MPSYEETLRAITALTRSDEAGRREVHWASRADVVGFSRTHEDRLEIFLVGSPLQPRTSVVRDAIEHGAWWRKGSSEPAFQANRLLLPAVGHFDQIAALIGTELLSNGAEADLSSAFRKTEPIIELAIERLRLSDQALVGLAGELLFLDALCRVAVDEVVPAVISSWDGWRHSLRDFHWGAIGVEIKATTRSNSSHQIHGTHQVEARDGSDGEPAETGLVLVSVGVRFCDAHANSLSVPTLVQRIVDRVRELNRPDLVDTFLAHVKEYGSGSGFGYDHRTMSSDAAFTREFEISFVRSYDMNDQNISVLRRSDVVSHVHVDPGSLVYTVDLPTTVSGDLNPTVGINQIAAKLLDPGATSSHG